MKSALPKSFSIYIGTPPFDKELTAAKKIQLF